jgi:hypothetical protein
MPISKNRRGSQRAITRGKIRKLQRAGLLSPKINPNRKPSKYILSKFYTYRSVISGRAAAVTVSTTKKAASLRNKIGEGGAGRVVIVPREKGERFRVVKDVIKSTRKQYGQTIEKTVGDRFTAPKSGEKVYYTLPKRRRGTKNLKRQTFASFDEMLFYLSKYDISFEDIEDYIEVEKFKEGSTGQKKLSHRIYEERQRYARRKRRKKSPRR